MQAAFFICKDDWSLWLIELRGDGFGRAVHIPSISGGRINVNFERDGVDASNWNLDSLIRTRPARQPFTTDFDCNLQCNSAE